MMISKLDAVLWMQLEKPTEDRWLKVDKEFVEKQEEMNQEFTKLGSSLEHISHK